MRRTLAILSENTPHTTAPPPVPGPSSGNLTRPHPSCSQHCAPRLRLYPQIAASTERAYLYAARAPGAANGSANRFGGAKQPLSSVLAATLSSRAAVMCASAETDMAEDGERWNSAASGGAAAGGGLADGAVAGGVVGGASALASADTVASEAAARGVG
jgi:hypothetical protein